MPVFLVSLQWPFTTLICNTILYWGLLGDVFGPSWVKCSSFSENLFNIFFMKFCTFILTKTVTVTKWGRITMYFHASWNSIFFHRISSKMIICCLLSKKIIPWVLKKYIMLFNPLCECFCYLFCVFWSMFPVNHLIVMTISLYLRLYTLE